MKIYLIRHGETQGNREGYFRGRSDFPLNENGKEQARLLAEALKDSGITRIYSGPLTRARQTAEILADKLGVPVVVEEGFNNINLGPWEGKKKEDIKREFPREFQLWITRPEELKLPGAETVMEVMERAVATLKRIVEEVQEESIAVVTHRAVLKPLIAGILDMRPPFFWKIHVDTASYSILKFKRERGFTLYLLNQTAHLKNFVVEEY